MKGRTLGRRLAEAMRRSRAAQKALDDARARVVKAQDRLAAERSVYGLPDVVSPTDADVNLIVAVDDWLAVRRELQAPLDEVRRIHAEYAEHLGVIATRRARFRALTLRATRLHYPEHLELARVAVDAISRVVTSRLTKSVLIALARRTVSPEETLVRYRRSNAYLVAALENFRETLDPDAIRREISGGVPAEIAARVEATPLLAGPFTSILRRYQDFGARYIVVQQRTILGDEMGLGKTVQALAAMCHLHELGHHRFLVVAPNSVFINWQRETHAHTRLATFALHGPDREAEVKRWVENGGVAVTTYGTLPRIVHLLEGIDLVVADEAHHAKNPATQRAKAVRRAADLAEHVVLLTGTALENRLPELRELAILVQPAIGDSLDDAVFGSRPDPDVIATMLASVYLRRTQDDVLKELPERIHVDEWVDLGEQDHAAYLLAPPTLVQKRLAAVVGDGSLSSAKYERLLELVDEHREAGQKIVVFSFFRRVIFDVSCLVDSDLVITGDTSPAERQHIIDRFSEAAPGSILVCQVEAGGTGINLQSAQVVVLMEPQLKPSTEWQAVARVHRMGQSRAVLVHRLLARRTVEERLVELLAMKESVFFTYAHDSAVKDASMMSVDTSDSRVARELQSMLDDGTIV